VSYPKESVLCFVAKKIVVNADYSEFIETQVRFTFNDFISVFIENLSENFFIVEVCFDVAV